MRKVIFDDASELEIAEYPIPSEPCVFEKKRNIGTEKRESLRITVRADHDTVLSKFSDGAKYLVREYYTDESGEEKFTDWDKSEFCVAGDIVDHRDGRITVYMGKKTSEELLCDKYESEKAELLARLAALEEKNAR